uniref:transglycosylase domain-containing protein n=1 Tax=Eisenbergiella massiliensis TaxID=1720294 RepID=UPI0023EFA9AA
GLGVVKGILASAPDTDIDVSPSGFSTFVYDAEGNQIAKLDAEGSNRVPVSMDKIPENLAHAFVAIEDARFYEHNGIDIKGIIRAGFIGLTSGHFSEGASTITQQLIKNNVLTSWKKKKKKGFAVKVKRKIQEQYLAIMLEKQMDKDKILENYMNTINLGQNTLGVQAASKRYFGKNVWELNLSECAVIAAITQNPSRYNPITHPEKNAERREKVLGDMLEQGYISQSEFDEALGDDVYSRIQIVNEETGETAINSYFVDALTEMVMEDLEAAGYSETQAFSLLYSGGLKIYSTQDPTIQAICDEVCSNEENYPDGTTWYLNYQLTIQHANGETNNYSKEMLEDYLKQNGSDKKYPLLFSSQDDAYAAAENYKASLLQDGDEVLAEKISMTPQPQISMTIEDQSTGNVVALVGGRGAKEANRTLNRATSTTRQPGSTFKIVSTYAPALDSAGLTLADVFVDAPFNYANGKPVSNWYSSGYRGICSLRDGIRDSLNIIAVKTLTSIKPQLGYDYLQNFGFTTLVESEERNGQIFSDIQQSLALGGITHGVTNMELNASYATIANGGTYIKPKLYTKIVDHDGNILIDNTAGESRQVIKESTAFLLTDAMVDVVTSGTGTSVNFGGMSIAGKTGTTSDYNDVWFAGYTPYYTCTTWTGYDNNAKLSGKNGERNLAKTLWRATMSKIHENLENKAFNVPADIVTATVCSQSGKLPIPGMCDETLKTEYFAKGTVPTETCDVHYQGMVCEYSGLPATEFCPFGVPGTVTMTPALDAALSGNVNQNADGTAANQCPHNAAFFADPNANAIIAQQQLELDARHMLANYDAQMANLQAALQNAQAVLLNAQQQAAAATDPDSQAAAQNAITQAQQEIDNLNSQIMALQNAHALQQQQDQQAGTPGQ